MRIPPFALAALAGLTLVGSAFAQTPAAPPASPAPTSSMPAPNAAAPAAGTSKAAIAKACSAEADQKGLHGKARKKFRSDCRRSKMM